jgi:hypothetical protein
LVKALGLGRSTIIHSEGDHRWDKGGGTYLLPNLRRHDACGCTFINNTSMDVVFVDGHGIWKETKRESGRVQLDHYQR